MEYTVVFRRKIFWFLGCIRLIKKPRCNFVKKGVNKVLINTILGIIRTSKKNFCQVIFIDVINNIYEEKNCGPNKLQIIKPFFLSS